MAVAPNLSARQLSVLRALEAFAWEHGYMPSLRELAREMGCAYATVRQHLDALKAKGWLASDGTAHGLRFRPGMLERLGRRVTEALGRVPVLGTIAAGRPIEVFEVPEEGIVVPAALMRPGAYALRVRGTSMVDDHILDGDVVVVEPVEAVLDGEVAVALLEDGTATLKRVYRERGRVRLQPANGAMAPIYAKAVRIQGRVTGMVRWYARW